MGSDNNAINDNIQISQRENGAQPVIVEVNNNQDSNENPIVRGYNSLFREETDEGTLSSY